MATLRLVTGRAHPDASGGSFDAEGPGRSAILTAIGTHALSSWSAGQSARRRVCDPMSALLPLVRDRPSPKLMAVVEVLAQLAVAVLQPGALGGGR